MIERLRKFWCGMFHVGHFERDELGRINWHCAVCGRWADYPVLRHYDLGMTDREITQWLDQWR